MEHDRAYRDMMVGNNTPWVCRTPPPKIISHALKAACWRGLRDHVTSRARSAVHHCTLVVVLALQPLVHYELVPGSRGCCHCGGCSFVYSPPLLWTILHLLHSWHYSCLSTQEERLQGVQGTILEVWQSS